MNNELSFLANMIIRIALLLRSHAASCMLGLGFKAAGACKAMS